MRCQYQYKHNPEKQCPYEATEGSQYCIFHERKESKDFRGKNLEKMDLEEAYLVEAKLDNATLINAILINADLEGASLTNAGLSGANLEGAILKNTNLENADLSEANLSGAELEGVNLRNSDMSGVKAEKVILRNSMLVNSDLSYAELKEADLEASDLSECNLFLAKLQGANLKECRLVNTTFRKAHLENANLKEINATNADFSDAFLIGTDLSYATLEGAIFHETNVEDAEFKNADVRYGRKWEYTNNLVPLKNDKKGREYLKKGEWKNAFKEFCYASKIYNDLSYYFKERGIGRKEDKFLIKKWEMNELACRAFLRLNPKELTEEEKRLLKEVLSLSTDSNFLKLKIRSKVIYYNILKRGTLLDFTKVLGVSIGIILLFSFLYWAINTRAPKTTPPITFEEALYFSIVTFMAFGYESYHPELHTTLRYLASLEALLGMVLLSLFVVTLYRKIVR